MYIHNRHCSFNNRFYRLLIIKLICGSLHTNIMTCSDGHSFALCIVFMWVILPSQTGLYTQVISDLLIGVLAGRRVVWSTYHYIQRHTHL